MSTLYAKRDVIFRNPFCLLLLAVILLFACKKDESITTDSSARLSFSTDSVLFDTIFTSVGSTTQRVKVFNYNRKAVNISHIALVGGNTSSYRVNINGKPASNAENVRLNGNDSLTVFIKVTIDPTSSETPFLVEDALTFVTNGNTQTIPLVAYGQNAHFINNSTLAENTVWDDKLPYVIYNQVQVAENATLTINAGARVYFHKDAKMTVAGTLNCQGTATDTISIASDRMERIYSEEPGQWTGIHFTSTSVNNRINHNSIKNALIGLQVDSMQTGGTPKLLLTNSEVKNMQVCALAGYHTNIAAFNNLFANCGQYLIYGIFGGDYNIKQNTFANYTYNFIRNTPSLYFSGNNPQQTGSGTNTLSINLTNNIVWGGLADELTIENANASTLQNNLIRTTDNTLTSNNFLNTDPGFLNPRQGNYQLSDGSFALDKGTDLSGDVYFSTFLQKDIKENLRLFPSELGCYEKM